MFVVTVLFEVVPDQADLFVTRVRQQAKDSLASEPGCYRFDVCIDQSIPERIFLYEIYTDKAAFDLHLASQHFKAFNEEVAPITTNKQVDTWNLQS